VTSLLRSFARPSPSARSISSVDDYIAAVSSMGFGYGGLDFTLGALTGTQSGQVAERISNDLEGFARSAMAANGVVFACLAVRMAVFSTIRFQWQRINRGKPSELFGSADLTPLESPWPGGTTQDLLTREIQHADLAGNAYNARVAGELIRLRPDWVLIACEPRLVRGVQVGWRRIGYVYFEGGIGVGDPAYFLLDEVSHFAPLPDPLASYRGMSWLTPVMREIQNDKAMTRHQQAFYENAATPNLSVSLDKEVRFEAFKRFKESMDVEHRGADNAGKTLYLGGGADVKVIGADFKQMDFSGTMGHGETRIAAAAGVPPVIVGLSEGLAAATYSNYAQARRRFADGTMHPLWQNAAGSLAPLITKPTGGSGQVRLWYDATGVPFLREDRKDAVEIAQSQAATIRQLIETGYAPDSVVRAVMSEDYGLLLGQHTGRVSVQLQAPGAGETDSNDPAPAEIGA
jgi:phage portal protein BeeE